MKKSAQEVIDQLKLIPLPEEGGYYKETYKDPHSISDQALPNHSGDRSYSTAIYYLVTPEEFSALHIVKSAELFHFYLGDPVIMLQLFPNGEKKECIIGPDIFRQQTPQVVVPPGVWQGTKLMAGGSWALLGCTVAPGFEFTDFKGPDREYLLDQFPNHAQSIMQFTRN